MNFLFRKAIILQVVVLTLGLFVQADAVSITFVGAPSGVNDGTDYVLPYQLEINGVLTAATCYYVSDNVIPGQTWTANELTLSEAESAGQFSSYNAAGYAEVGFLFQQTANTPQEQIDLQHDIWNVFGGDYAVTTGMQAYLNLLGTSAYTNFDFGTVLFLEDVNQGTGRAQAFVIDPPAAAPEPSTIMLMVAGALLMGIGRMKARKLNGEGVGVLLLESGEPRQSHSRDLRAPREG